MKKYYEEELKKVTSQLGKIQDYLNGDKVLVSESLERYIRFLIEKHEILINNLYQINENKISEIPTIKL